MANQQEEMHYRDFGDDYGVKDPFKKYAQLKAATTGGNLDALGYREISGSRGESAFVVDVGPFHIATTPEGLGVKNLITDNVGTDYSTYYQYAAEDTVASIINDLITVGARPLVVNAHWAVGSNEWFKNKKRYEDLIDGWVSGCSKAWAIYGAGETPTLRGIVQPNAIELSGSAVGIINPKSHLTLGDKLREGDHIMLIASNGLHCNGASLAMQIAEERLPNKYNTILPSGRTLGEALLSPSHIYARLQAALFEQRVDIHYMAHITGHGWPKLMRAERELTYRIHAIPKPQEEFKLLQAVGNLKDENAYATFNMGAGFAFFVPEKDIEKVQTLAQQVSGFKSWDAGIVEKGPRQVIIDPLKITYTKDSLDLR